MNQYKELKKIYNQAGYASYSDKLDRDEIHMFYIDKLTEYLFDKFESIPFEGAFLEIGCGKGHFVKSFFEKGFDAYGIDLSYHALTTIKRNDTRINALRSYAEALPFKNEAFKLILLHHVIEHVIDIEALLNEFHRVTINNALICIVTTTVPFGLVEHWRKFGIFSDKTHMSLYTKKYWVNFFSQRGFAFLEDVQDIVCIDPPTYLAGRPIYDSGFIGRIIARKLSRIVRGSFLFEVVRTNCAS